MTIQGASRALVTAFLLTSSWTAWAQSAPSPYPRAGLDASPAAPASPSAEVSSPRAPLARAPPSLAWVKRSAKPGPRMHLEATGQSAELLVGRHRHADRAADRRPCCFPCGARKQARPWVGVAQRADGKEIAPADRAAQAVEHAQSITGQVERAISSFQLSGPPFRHECGRWRSWAPAACVHATQVFDRIEQRPTRRRRAEVEPG